MSNSAIENDDNVLCVSSVYEQKYYFNKRFAKLPEIIQNELQIMCVMFTEEVGGELILEFDEDGTLLLRVSCDEGDILYDDISSGLKIRQIQRDNNELFEQLEQFYKAFCMENGERSN